MPSLLLIALQALISATALLLLKLSIKIVAAKKLAAGALALAQFGFGGALYVGSFLLWMYILSRTQLTYAYPVSVAVTIAFSTLGAWLFLGEKLSWQLLVGVVLIVAGIATLSLKS